MHYFYLNTPINQGSANYFPLRRFDWTGLPMYAYLKVFEIWLSHSNEHIQCY